MNPGLFSWSDSYPFVVTVVVASEIQPLTELFLSRATSVWVKATSWARRSNKFIFRCLLTRFSMFVRCGSFSSDLALRKGLPLRM
jgi:hypothetical protein